MTDISAVETATVGTDGPEGPANPPKSGRRRWNGSLLAGVIIFAVLIAIAIIMPMFLSNGANQLTDNANAPISSAHLLGTDKYGHDILARTLVATRLTLIMTFCATAIGVVFGIIIGTGLWLAPRSVREVGLRVIDVLVMFPGLLLALVLASILGQGVWPAVLAIGFATVPAFARLTANLASRLASQDFVQTARLLGVPSSRLAFRHLIPNMAEPLFILMASSFAIALVDLSALSFIGLGVQSPNYDFGYLLNDALQNIYTQPSQVFGPAVMIIITGLAGMLVGDGLAAMSNPRSHRFVVSKRELSDADRYVELPPVPPKTVLTVDDVHVWAKSGKEIIKGVSLHIGEGEILGVVGESGSGKSTVAMYVAKLLDEELEGTARRVQLGELNLLEHIPSHTLATRIGLVYQDPGSTFNPALRMGTQLSDVLRVHLKMTKKEALSTVLAGFKSVHLTLPEQRLRQHPHELSGGMRQRAMISSAMNTSPKLVIADEPTTALDVTVQRDILSILKRTNRETGTAMLFISHDIGVVRELCDRVIVMKDGHVVEEVRAENLEPDKVQHPYTKHLLETTPSIEFEDPAAAMVSAGQKEGESV